MRFGGLLHWPDLHRFCRITRIPTVLASSSQLAGFFSTVIVRTNPGGISSLYMVGRMPSCWNCVCQTTPPASLPWGCRKPAFARCKQQLFACCSHSTTDRGCRQAATIGHLGRKALAQASRVLRTPWPSLSLYHAPCILRNPSAC
jgi:hypothetical protein